MGGTPRIGPATKSGHGVPLVPSKRPFRERMPDQTGRTLGKQTVAAFAIDVGPQEGAATEESVTVGNGLYLAGQIGGNGVSFLVDTGSGVSILAARTWRKWGRTEDELTRYWGRLCSVEGRALECLGKARLTVSLGTRVVEWGFIVVEIGDDAAMRGCRVSPGPRWDGKRTHGRTFTMHHPGSHRGEGGNRGNLGGPGRGVGDAGTTHRLTGKGDRSYSPGPRDGDGGSRTRTAGAVPGPRNS